MDAEQVAGQRFCWDAVLDDRPVVRVAVNWLMGTEHLEPAWTLGEAGEVRNHGVVATANHCVNSIPYVVRAEPGIKTFLDLPVIACRAHPRFARRA